MNSTPIFLLSSAGMDNKIFVISGANNVFKRFTMRFAPLAVHWTGQMPTFLKLSTESSAKVMSVVCR